MKTINVRAMKNWYIYFYFPSGYVWMRERYPTKDIAEIDIFVSEYVFLGTFVCLELIITWLYRRIYCYRALYNTLHLCIVSYNMFMHNLFMKNPDNVRQMSGLYIASLHLIAQLISTIWSIETPIYLPRSIPTRTGMRVLMCELSLKLIYSLCFLINYCRPKSDPQ